MQEESRAGNRLINTNFLKSLTRLTNRALLLYYSFITWADSMGAVGEAEVILTLLQAKADNEGDTGVGLVKTDYRSALDELVEKGLVYEVKLTGGNAVYIIKHWWLHNKWVKYLKTNYFKAINEFYIEQGEYRPKNERKKKNQKERKEEQVTKTKTKTKTNYSSNEELTSQIECVGTHEEPLCNEENEEDELLYSDLVLYYHNKLNGKEIDTLFERLVSLGFDKDQEIDETNEKAINDECLKIINERKTKTTKEND